MSESHSWHLAEGDRITPELTVLRRLGGGYAYEVFLAFDEITYVAVVAKVVRPDQVHDDHTLRGLRREVEALALVNHPSVVRGLRFDLENERPHVVLQHIEGPRLSSLIRRHGRLQEQQYLPLAIEVAAALHYLRGVDLLHLDIKPSNVIMAAPARLIDLSIARPSADAARSRQLGTDYYMSPEQADPDTFGPPGFPSDVWGLGATLFHAVAGYRAFDKGSEDAEELAGRFPQVVDEPYDLPDDVPGPVREVIAACLDKDPAKRPLPSDVVDAFEPVLAGLPAPKLTFKVRG
ncbi:serine/threonine-protein kinase [Nocardioides sp.]|uniref:serine/threonine-protein kinase n=1 Tax=Nocardioides sp. TaxID=35761 RepID=UPI002ED5DED4